MTNGISNLQPGEPNKLLDSILANLPAPIPVDAPIGQWHVDWFLWFIDTGIPYVVQVHEEEPLESLDWRRLGFPLYVGYAWDWLVGEFGYQWDINTLNWILAHWGDGGFVGDDIPTTTGISGVFTTPDGMTGNTALARIITTSNVINLLPNLYGNAFEQKGTPTTPTIEPSHKGAYKVFETGTSNYIVYVKGDTVSYSNTTYSANKETKGGNRPDKSIDWDKVSEADIIGIAITADAGLTGTIRTENGFHYQNITVATGGITTAHIADNAITSSKIADGAILGVDVAVGVTLTNPDITGDAEVFGNVFINGTAASALNNNERRNPVLKISGTNRDVAIDCGAGGISAGGAERTSTFYNAEVANQLSAIVGISAQAGLIDGLTGNFNNVVAHGGISAGGATFGGDVKVNDLTVGRGGDWVTSNTAVGYQALDNNSVESLFNVGELNSAFGYQALYSNTIGKGNVASGYKALYSNTEGNYNVASGYAALYNNTEGDYNVASGYAALYNNTEGDGNVASGYKALYSNTTGNSNIASGYQALYSNTEGYMNVASGYRALYSNTEGNYNVASGYQALYSNTGGDYNVASGYQTLYNNTEGAKNIASGYQALYSNTGGDNNVASGYRALFNNTEGDYNVASGYYALYNNTIGDRNSALGPFAGSNGTTGSNNTYIGYNAQPSSATVNNEIVLGDSNVTLIHSAAGMSMGGDISAPSVNTLTIGKGGGDVATNTAVGYQALYNNTEGNWNVASGYQALYSNTGGDGNVASGFAALYNNITGDGNVASGYAALFSNTEGYYNVATGMQALYSNTGGDGNVASGYQTLYNNTEGDGNIASGYRALYNNTEGDYNVATGYAALYNNTEGLNNIAYGRRALFSNTVGDNNSALGYLAGQIGTTGSNNTYIGFNAQPSSATVNNEIVLGDSNVTLIHSAAGMSMGGGATFGGDVNFLGNILLPEDGEVSIGGDTEKIVFNGAGDGSSSIDMYVANTDFGTNSTSGALRSANDEDTQLNFEKDKHGAGSDGLELKQSGNVMIDVTPTQVHFPFGISADAGATFGGNVIIHGGISASGISTDNIHVKSGISAGTLVTGNTAEFTSLVGAKGVSAAGATIGGYWAGVQEETIGVSVNNGSSVLTTGVKGHRTIPYACDIVDWRVTSTDSGAIEWGINYCTYANFPTMTANAIHTSEAPGIAATGSKDTSSGAIPARWTKYQFDAGDIIEFEIDSVTTLTNCILELTIRRTS